MKRRNQDINKMQNEKNYKYKYLSVNLIFFIVNLNNENKIEKYHKSLVKHYFLFDRDSLNLS
jgi:hypothetical protein